jgi:DHA1 family tetracycline resistance protein-like MFS transporter
MIAIFTPMILKNDTAMIAANTPMARKTILLGFLLAVYPFGQFVGSPVMGSLSDRFGRKPVLLISLSITTLCYALISTALNRANLGLLCAALVVAGLAEANIVTAQSAIADVVPAEERNRFFGYIYMSVSAAYIVGPLGGGKLADPELASWFNYATPFWTVMILLAVTTAVTAIVFTETNPREARHAVSYLEALTNLAGVVLNRRLRALYWLNFFLYLAIFGFFRCYPMFLVDEFHLGVSRVSEFIAWVGVPIVLANVWLTGFLSTRMSVRTLTFWSALLTGVFMVIVVVPRPQHALWVTLFLTSRALALCLPSCATLLSVAAGETDQGRVMGNNQALQVGAEAFSGVLGGAVAAIMVKLSLIVLGGIAIAAAACLPFIRTSRTA